MLYQSGQMIGSNYEIESPIAQGGMAEVYRARHRVLGSSHAVKILLPNLAVSQDIRIRFLEEGKIQARYRHPHIVQVTDIINEAGTAGLVMNWLEGRTLRDHLDQVRTIPLQQTVCWIIQALDALAYVHSHGIIHRDLKPENLFIENMWRGGASIQVLDFGIAKVFQKERTRTAVTMGSLGYMPPEQFDSSHEADARSDLFSIGVIIYEMLSGRPAFSGKTMPEVMKRISEGWQDTMADALPGGPRLAAVMQTALQLERRDRFQSADQFAEALQQVVSDLHRSSAPQGSTGEERAVAERSHRLGEAERSRLWEGNEESEYEERSPSRIPVGVLLVLPVVGILSGVGLVLISMFFFFLE